MWDIHFPWMKTVGITHWETCLPSINGQEIYTWFRHLRIKIQRILRGQERPKAISHQQLQFYKQLLHKIYKQDMNFQVHMTVAIRIPVLSDWRRGKSSIIPTYRRKMLPLSSGHNTQAVRFPHNVGTYPVDVTVSHTRRQYSQQQL